jgi:hypothetical protein
MSEDISKEPLLPSRRKLPREPDDDLALDYEEMPPSPQMVKTAGVIWIVVGCMLLLNLVALLVISFVFAANMNGQAANVNGQAAAGVVGGLICVAFIVGLFGAAFLYVGNQTVRGTARDTIGNSIGSIVFALFQFAGAAGNGISGRFVQSGVSAVGGTLLLTAGVLALAGRSQYKLWRKVQVARLKRETADRKAERRFRK